MNLAWTILVTEIVLLLAVAALISIHYLAPIHIRDALARVYYGWVHHR